ncbi:C40 family peptidase [Synechococcus sp. PCC 7336]|uniref:C40 family peptidase n=1 Tax=Synechococcus sp. PCC 7336 TaxID=195250 RepID=UPI000346DE9A|nr:C40 family peptidase [Synechococcus sp. PCC 7336]
MTLLYQSVASLDLFESPSCSSLVTQCWPGRYFHQLEEDSGTAATPIQLLEDGYSGYIATAALSDPAQIASVTTPPAAVAPLTSAEIEARLQTALAYAAAASQQANRYLWGGTVGPNFDCSGLVQRSFAAAGIWLPRDSYQQADFCQTLCEGIPTESALADFRAGDLIFFQFDRRVDHVAIYWGDGRYLHSSGPERGRDGLAWDLVLPAAEDAIACRYRQHICRVGRVSRSLPFPIPR